MKPRIENLSEKKLIGKRLKMSIVDNKTQELWQSFMTRRNEIKNNIGIELYSMQMYDTTYFDHFNPNAVFEKWATVEVTDFDTVPKDMEYILLPSGLYAVFLYKGDEQMAFKAFQYIFETWLPKSEYDLDHRPHFEVLGEKYKRNDVTSEEDIWIPIKKKETYF